MNIQYAIPLIRIPARIPGATLAVLSSHPATKVEGVVIRRNRNKAPEIITTAEWSSLTHQLADTVWTTPFRDLVVRLLPQCGRLLDADDLARLIGMGFWHTDQQALLISGVHGMSIGATIRNALDRLEQIVSWATDLLDERELDGLHVHERINGRGIHIDRILTGWLDRAILTREQQRSLALDAALNTSGSSVSDALKAGGIIEQILKRDGITSSGRSEEDILELLDNPALSQLARRALEAVLGHGRIAGAKVRRILLSIGKDDRLRHQFRIWGARTYRFTSNGVQLQNLPKPIRGTDFRSLIQAMPQDLSAHTDSDMLERLSSSVPSGLVEDAFAATLRLCLTAKPDHLLVVLDWNAIEPRIRAWISDDSEHLDQWRRGDDLYIQLISEILHRVVTKEGEPHMRDVGKIADVGCGYQMGAEAFELFCRAFGIDLDSLGLTAAGVVVAYRKRYHRLSSRRNGLWSRLEFGALQAMREGESSVGHVRFRRSPGGHIDLILPNDAFRRYWNPAIVMRSPPWAENGDCSQDRPAIIVSRHPEEQPSDIMYGGRWLENICQSIGREILMDLLLATESRGDHCVAHCHDEVVFEVPEESADIVKQRLIGIAETSPTWARGLPLKVEAFIAPFWAKKELAWWRQDQMAT